MILRGQFPTDTDSWVIHSKRISTFGSIGNNFEMSSGCLNGLAGWGYHLDSVLFKYPTPMGDGRPHYKYA